MKKIKKILALALCTAFAITAAAACGKKSNAPTNLNYDQTSGKFSFNSVTGGDIYTVGVSRIINNTTGDALKSMNGAALINVGGKSVYLWAEQAGSASGLADNDGDGVVDGTVIYRKYSSSATEVGAVMKATDLGVGHYIFTAVPSATDKLSNPEPAYLEFVVAGTLAEPADFVAALNDEGKMSVTAPSSFYLTCLTSTGMPEKMLFEVFENGTLVDSFEMADFSYTNSVNGPNKSFSFNNNTATGTKVLDRSKTYTVKVTAVGDGGQIKDASSAAMVGTNTAAISFASTLDTKGSATLDGYSVKITLGKDAAGNNTYELSATLQDVAIYRESGTYTASAEATQLNEKNTYPADTKIEFKTNASDFDAPVLEGKSLSVKENNSMFGGTSYGLIGDVTINGKNVSFSAESGSSGGPGGPGGQP